MLPIDQRPRQDVSARPGNLPVGPRKISPWGPGELPHSTRQISLLDAKNHLVRIEFPGSPFDLILIGADESSITAVGVDVEVAGALHTLINDILRRLMDLTRDRAEASDVDVLGLPHALQSRKIYQQPGLR